MNRQIGRKQVGAIEVYHPKETDSEQSGFGTCLCCGEDAQTYGMCLRCVQHNCSASFSDACSRTGAEDPLAVTDSAFTGGVQL
jgi:hypothetical protein